MDTYIITAKTVEEAISSAKKQYEDENHEVSYEILEMPKKGLFGLGAKDAKVKITVSKTEKVELGSLVAEMRSMKNLTDRSGSGSGDTEKTAKKSEQKQQKQPRPQQNQQPKPQNPQPKQPKPADGQKPQNQPKQQKQGEGKPAQNSQNKPAQPKPQGEKQGQPKQQNPQNQQPKQPKEPKAADGQNQPKEPKEPKQPKQQNPQNPPKEPKEPKQPKEPKPVKVEAAAAEAVESAAEKIETAAGAAAETSRLDQAILSATTVTTKFGDAGAEYKSSLHNSSRPNRRAPQKHGSNADEKIDASAVTVSQPMGLTDFVTDPNAQGFGKGSGSGNSAGKMNNDVRKKKKNAPKTAGDKKPESTAARYDFAESDDDYEKLDRLVSEAESELEAAEAAVLVPKMPAEAAEIEETDDSDADELAPARETRRREAITQEEMDYALAFANTLLDNMKLEARAVAAECPEGEEFDTTEEATVYPKIDIVGDDTGILIGHHGETLDSIQYLTNLSALRKTKSRDGDYVKIVVDIENYREKREDTLRTLARRMAARAVKYKRNVFLEPMNAYERRIIHSELQSFENVSTHSVGADRDRKIIITYEGPDKQPDNRQNNGGRRRRGDKAPAEESGASANANAENGAAKENGGNGNGRNRRRPRKSQKMPIEKLDELLPGGEETAAVTEAAEAAETISEKAAEAVEAAAEQVISEAAESVQSDEE